LGLETYSCGEMKLQVGDIFVATNTGNIGLLVCKKEEHRYQYYINWTSGTKAHYTKSEIQYWVDGKNLIHYPVVK
jgi:membrane-bound inhibitor of C-type lysozyme